MNLFDDLPEETCKPKTIGNSDSDNEKTWPTVIVNESGDSDSTDDNVKNFSSYCLKRKSGADVGGKNNNMQSVKDCSLPSKKFKDDDNIILLSSFAHGRKGERDEMQDHHVMFDDLSKDLMEKSRIHIYRVAYYGVFDGHAGARASQYAAERLHKIIVEKFPIGDKEKIERDMKKCLVDSFKAVDEEFLKQASKQRPVWKDGTTATVVLIVDNVLYVANIGDSKAVLCRAGMERATANAIALTKDHNPTLHEERMRIQKAGGSVRDGRVNGVLELSRSIGDGHYKQYGVTCIPDVRKCNLTDRDRYVLIACDGLWKSFTNEEAVNYVEKIAMDETTATAGENTSAAYDTVCSCLSAEAVRRLSGDNVTVLLVKFKHPR